MTCVRSSALFASLFVVACGGDDVPADDGSTGDTAASSSSGADDGTTSASVADTSGDTSASSGGSTGTESSSSGDGSSTESSSTESSSTESSSTESSSSDDSGTTGDTDGSTAAPLELLVKTLEAGANLRFHLWRTSEDGVEGPTQIVPDDDGSWSGAERFADRRIVYRVEVDQDHDDLWLGNLDDADDLVQLDVAPMIEGDLGFIAPIADDAILIHARDQLELYRIDFPGGVPQAPVLVVPDDPDGDNGEPAVDPTGRWVAVPGPSVSGDLDVVLARYDAPNPAEATTITSVGPGESAMPAAIDATGSSLFAYAYGADGGWLEHVDIRGDVPGAPSVAHVLEENTVFQNFVTRSQGDGLSYLVWDFTASPSTFALTLVRVDDGVPLAPDVVFEGSTEFNPQSWSPDGRWLAASAVIGGATQQFLARVDDDAPTAVFAFDDVDDVVFAPDSAYAYVVHETGGTFELGRIDTSGDDAGMVETVVLESDRIIPGAPLDVRVDLGAVLFAGVVGDAPSLLLVEVGGALPAEPIVVNPPFVGLGLEGGSFSPDGTYAIYGEYDGLGNSWLQVTDLAHPGTATVVIDDYASWEALPAER